MTKLTKTASTAVALAAGIGVLASLLTFIPATQADSTWRVRTAPRPVQTYLDTTDGLIRFYAGGKQVAILQTKALLIMHPDGR